MCINSWEAMIIEEFDMNFIHNILLLYRGSLVIDDTFRGKMAYPSR
jgi:hypothetical protein